MLKGIGMMGRNEMENEGRMKMGKSPKRRRICLEIDSSNRYMSVICFWVTSKCIGYFLFTLNPSIIYLDIFQVFGMCMNCIRGRENVHRFADMWCIFR
jgi:hypothetical protein